MKLCLGPFESLVEILKRSIIKGNGGSLENERIVNKKTNSFKILGGLPIEFWINCVINWLNPRHLFGIHFFCDLHLIPLGNGICLATVLQLQHVLRLPLHN